MTAPESLEDMLTRIAHEALLVEHFGSRERHPAYEDPDSAMGRLATRLASVQAAEVRKVMVEAAAVEAVCDAAMKASVERGGDGPRHAAAADALQTMTAVIRALLPGAATGGES